MKNGKGGRPLVYICSRYSGDVSGNVKKAQEYSRFAADNKTVPIAPHLLFPQFIKEESERDLALELDVELLRRCDEVWVFGIENGISEGMAMEISNAGNAGQDIRYFDAECREVFI